MADVELTDDDERFRRDVAAWLADHVVGEYAELKGRGGPGDEDVGFDVRVAWEHELGKAGFIGLGWPVEYGGRGATLDQQIIWAEEYARAEAPARVNHMGENLLAPDAHRVRHRRAAGAVPPRHPARRRALVPGLQRAQRGLRPRQRRRRARRARRRRVGRQRPEGVDVARARVALVLRGRAHRSRLAAPQGPVVPARADGPARRRGAADRADHRRRRVQRGVLRRRPHRSRRSSSARSATAGGSRWACSASSAACRRSRSRSGFERELDHVLDLARARDRRRRPGLRHAARRRVDRAAAHEVERDAQHGGEGRARPGGVDLQAVLGHVAPRPRRADRSTCWAPRA